MVDLQMVRILCFSEIKSQLYGKGKEVGKYLGEGEPLQINKQKNCISFAAKKAQKISSGELGGGRIVENVEMLEDTIGNSDSV